MPIHNWTAVNPAFFHDFHFGWVSEICRTLNHGILPAGCYALSQHQFSVDTMTDAPTDPICSNDIDGEFPAIGGVSASEFPPKASYHFHAYSEYLTNSIAVRHESLDQVIAMIEIISPHNKDTSKHLKKLVDKIQACMRSGIHVLLIDLIASNKLNPDGIHPVIWDDISGYVRPEPDSFHLPGEKVLTLASYLASGMPEAFVEPVGLDGHLPDMPLFLTADRYVNIPLGTTYQAAFQRIAEYCQQVVESASIPNQRREN